MHKNKTKNPMRKEDEKLVENMEAGDLKALLEEVVSYKHPGDMSGKSPLVQGLLKQAEESESGEESIKRPPQELKRHKKPKERRRRKESDSLAARTHAGGSLDNIAGDKKQKVAKQRGVAGRTREGGSCCNLSRGSFETVARRRRRRDPHRQHGGSLEDLSAIDETSAGAGRAKSSVSESGKHGGSLQNIQQEATAGGGGGGDFRPPAEQPAPPPVIEIDAEEEAEVVTLKRPEPRSAQASPRVAAGATAAPEGGAPPEREQQRPDDTVEFPLKLEQRQRAPFGMPADLSAVTRNVGNLLHTSTYTPEDVEDMPEGERLAGVRRSQVSSDGAGAACPDSSGPGSGNGGQRHGPGAQSSGRPRKNKKKEEPKVLTESVEGYRGNDNIDTLIDFLESGSKKDKPNGGSSKKSEKNSKKDTKSKKNGVKAAEEERGGRGAERRPPARGGKAAPAGRSSSLEARSGAAAAPAADASSKFCGDLAKSSLKKSDSMPPRPPGPSVCSTDGSAYVSASASDRESEGFVQDFYSVTTDSTAIEETEFHVVTRKQRKRGGGGAAAGRGPSGDSVRAATAPARHRAAAADEPAPRPRHDSLVQPRRPHLPGPRHAASASAPHSELSDSDSDGGETAPPPAAAATTTQAAEPASAAATSRAARLSPTPTPSGNSRPMASVGCSGGGAGGSGSGSGASSWADVTRSRQESGHSAQSPPAPSAAPSPPVAASAPAQADTRDAETSTDFIDGAGPIFGERASPRSRPVAAVSAVVRGASQQAGTLIAGSHPDEFPEISPPPATARAATPTQPPAAAAKPPSASKPARQAGQPEAAVSSVPPRAAASSATDSASVVLVPASVQTVQTDTAVSASAAGPVSTARDANDSVIGTAVPAPAAAVPAPASSAPAPQPSPAPAAVTLPAAAGSAARRAKKTPAVIIRETLNDGAEDGEANLQVHGIRFGYIDTSDRQPEVAPPPPTRAVAVPLAAPPALEAFCRRFRSPLVNTSRINLPELYAYLGKGYEFASRDPNAFFKEGRSPPRHSP